MTSSAQPASGFPSRPGQNRFRASSTLPLPRRRPLASHGVGGYHRLVADVRSVAEALVRSGTAQEAKAITGEAPRWTQGTRDRRVAAGNGGLRSRQGGFTQFARPVFPAPVAARMERAALGLPPGFAPRRPRAGRRTPGSGTGHRARTWTTRSTHISRSPIGSARFRPT
jgi:hypothetical protein